MTVSRDQTVYGLTDRGVPTQFNATAEGHLEVAIHGPRLPFGSVHVESLKPVFQVDGVYGLNTFLNRTSTGLAVGSGSGSGSVTGSGNKIVAATGTTQYSFATVQSRRRLRYRPGQGVVGRFAGYFSSPVASSIVVAGWGSAEAGIYFGYNGTTFGILHSTGGGAAKSNQGLTTFYIIRNAALTGPVNFTSFSTASCTYIDTAATGCTFNQNQLIWSGPISEAGNFSRAFSDRENSIQPGERITFAVRSVTATAVCVGSLNVREDQ